jgi:hypothetical protein
MLSIEALLQLHECVEVVYVVDGYNARLTTNDGADVVVEVFGISFVQAIDNLNTLLARRKFTLEQMRAGAR